MKYVRESGLDVTATAKHLDLCTITNSTILDLLRAYTISQPHTWDTHLQFAYNNTPHIATQKAPFEIIMGIDCLPLLLLCLIKSNKVKVADDFVDMHATIFAQVKEMIAKAQQSYTKQANKKKKAMIFQIGDYVWLHIEKRRLHNHLN